MTDYQTSPGFHRDHGQSSRERWAGGWAGVHESVFAKLMTIMVAMAACLVLRVTTFFWIIVSLMSNTEGHQTHDEEPGLVHYVRSVGAVIYTSTAIFLLPVGATLRTDAASPGNCPF